ncbi:hypothetical protein AeMF1_002193 [Aphanomyces euteiches]|nr:hypothetical protein AeMF1_002193 [Aphanomyces euteiches]KAH9191782.1 hypothetical protein AeNC1_006252 [Aphanomyces euteiches]
MMARIPWARRAELQVKATNWLIQLVGSLGASLVIVDMCYNNWELINYMGNAQYLLTPLYNHGSLHDVALNYVFPTEASPSKLSEGGIYMLNSTISNAYNRDRDYYFLTAGSYLIEDAQNDICGTLAKSYPNVNASMTTINLGVTTNSLFYVRGSTLMNFFGLTSTTPAPAKANGTTLAALGYAPARQDCDLRLTTSVAVPPSGSVVSANVTMYRFFAKSYCSGCNSVVELGRDTCAIVYSYNATTRVLKVQSSQAFIGDYHFLGVMLERSGPSVGSLYIRGLCVFLAALGYQASKKTIRWTDATALASWYRRILHTLAPPLYRYSSKALSFSMYCLNSDLFVFGYTTAMLLDEKQSMIFNRHLTKWNTSGNAWIQIQLFAIQFRWLWLNCALVKVAKWLFNFVSLTRYTGKNLLVGWCNFSSVIYVYVGAIFLLQRTNFIQYGNNDSVTLTSTTDNLNTIRLDLFESQYVRAIPDLILVMIANLIMVLALDHILHFRWWRRMTNNSLGRQVMYNSTSIVADMQFEFFDGENYKGQAMAVHARALCTVQWFLLCHTWCFGLQEDPKRVRAMVTNGINRVGGGDNRASAWASSDSVRQAAVAYDPMTFRGKKASVQPEIDEEGDLNLSSSSSTLDLYMIAQDPEGHVRLYDARKREIQAMSLEVKILNDAKYIVA